VQLYRYFVSFAAITLCVASQRVFIVVSVYFVIDSVRKLLDTPCTTPEFRELLSVQEKSVHVGDITYETNVKGKVIPVLN
jgi:hypothetical protein